ncbi:MAG: ankyrin repeat domain-containing protein [Rhodospirillaceae bacterium]
MIAAIITVVELTSVGIFPGRTAEVARRPPLAVSPTCRDRPPLTHCAGASQTSSSVQRVRLWCRSAPRGYDDARTRFGDTPLFDAALIAAGADVNASDRRGDSPLHVAAYAGNVAAALVLIDRGASVLARNDRGETPIDLAIRYGHEAVSAILTGLLDPGPSVAGYAAAAV